MDDYSIDSHKLHLHPERVAPWLSGHKLETYPIYVEISPVGHCNHRCTFCAVDYIGYKARALNTNSLQIILYEMGQLGVKSVMYAGEGEPLLHKDICQIVEDTNGAGIDCAFTTNGVLADKIIPVLDHIKWIKVSCNAGDHKTYAKIHKTKEADFTKVWNNLRHLVRIRKKSTVIGVQAVLLPENAETMEDLVKCARESGLDYVVIKPYSQHKKSITHAYEEVKYGEYGDLLAKLNGYNTKGFQVIARTKSMGDWDKGKHSYSKCLSTPYFWAYIMATGDVYGCSAYLLDDRFKYGNINEACFRDIWQGERRKQSMAYVDKELDISECRLNCRMNKVNQYLWELKHPGPHASFI